MAAPLGSGQRSITTGIPHLPIAAGILHRSRFQQQEEALPGTATPQLCSQAVFLKIFALMATSWGTPHSSICPAPVLGAEVSLCQAMVETKTPPQKR